MRTLQELNDLEDVRALRLDYTHHFDAGARTLTPDLEVVEPVGQIHRQRRHDEHVLIGGSHGGGHP